MLETPLSHSRTLEWYTCYILEHFCTNVKISDQNLKQKDEQTSKMQVIPTSYLFCLQSHYTRCDAKPCSGSSCPCSKNGAECNDACHMGRSELRTFIMPLQPTWNAVFMFNKRILFYIQAMGLCALSEYCGWGQSEVAQTSGGESAIIETINKLFNQI